MPVLIGPASDECPNCPTCLHETVNTEMQWIPGPERNMSSSFPGLPQLQIFLIKIWSWISPVTCLCTRLL